MVSQFIKSQPRLKLQQELENKYVDDFTFYLAKKARETTTFTSFSNLVKAINQNLSGTYHLAASLNANEVELDPDAKSYIKGALLVSWSVKRWQAVCYLQLEKTTVRNLEWR